MNEETWDRWRTRFGFVAAPVAALAIVLAFDGDKAKLGAIAAATAILWITEAIPLAVTSLLTTCACVAFGLASPKEAFAAFGNPILFLFLGSFLIAEAVNIHGLGARLARAMSRGAKGTVGAMVATSTAAFVLSMWTSNAAATAVVLPVALATARSFDDKRARAALVLAVAWGASMGGLATPVGTPPNLIGIRALADVDGGAHALSFFQWCAIGTPFAVVMHIAMLIMLAVLFRLRATKAPPPPSQSPPWSQPEIAALVAFVVAVVLWIVPGVLDAFDSPFAKPFHKHVPEEVVALACAALLFAWPVKDAHDPKRVRALEWRDAQQIDWGTLMLFGGGVLLGDLANKTGLASSFGQALVDVTGASTELGVLALVTAVSLVLSELASNTASATLMVPVAIGLAHATHTPTLPAVLGATIGSSFGFMMPISTAPNAMAYATGEVSIRQMLVAGIFFDIVGFIVVVAGLSLVASVAGS